MLSLSRVRGCISLSLILAALAGCSHPPVQPSVPGTGAPLAPELRAELLTRLQRDQAVRNEIIAALHRGASPDSAIAARMMDVDTANTAWIARILAQRGWPGPKLVGADGEDAAFILVQHADRDTALQARVLPFLARAYAHGEATGQQVALLTDRLAAARGQPQVYGTQASIAGGRVMLKPIADSAHVDARRASMGLQPLSEYVRMLDSLYAPQPPNPDRR